MEQDEEYLTVNIALTADSEHSIKTIKKTFRGVFSNQGHEHLEIMLDYIVKKHRSSIEKIEKLLQILDELSEEGVQSVGNGEQPSFLHFAWNFLQQTLLNTKFKTADSSKSGLTRDFSDDLFVTLVYNCFWKLTATLFAEKDNVTFLPNRVNPRPGLFRPQTAVQALHSAIQVPVSVPSASQVLCEKLTDLILHFKDQNQILLDEATSQFLSNKLQL
jgi:hypothetical protein